MTTMRDSENVELPPDNDGTAVFDLSLIGNRDQKEPWLGLNVPMSFRVPRGNGEDSVYSSAGVLGVDLRDVLEEYVQRDHAKEDGGNSLSVVEALLREYADKIVTVRLALHSNWHTEPPAEGAGPKICLVQWEEGYFLEVGSYDDDQWIVEALRRPDFFPGAKVTLWSEPPALPNDVLAKLQG